MTDTTSSSEACMKRTIPAYIGLLCAGERELSRRLLETAVELSGALTGVSEHGSPAADERDGGRYGRVAAPRRNGEYRAARALSEASPETCASGGGGGYRSGGCILAGAEESPQELRERALRALLAALLVLRVSPYWHRVPALEELFSWCLSLSARLDAARIRAGYS